MRNPLWIKDTLGTFARNFRNDRRWIGVLTHDFHFALYIIDLTRDRGYEALRCYAGNDMH